MITSATKQKNVESKNAVISPAPPSTGVGRYAKMLADALQYDYIMFPIKDSYDPSKASFSLNYSHKKFHVFMDYYFGIYYKKFVKNLHNVVFATPDFFYTAENSGYKIGIIHDFFPIKNSYIYKDQPFAYRHFMNLQLTKHIRKLNLILVQSKYTQSEAMKFINISPQVLYPAVYDDQKIDKKEARRQIAKRYGIPENTKILLNVSSPLRRKGLDVLDKIRKILRKEVVLITVSNNHGDIVLTNIPDKFLSVLYAGADAYISTSYDEGFDLPVIEAIAHGTPVIASDITVHREIASMQHGIYLYHYVDEAIEFIRKDNLPVSDLNPIFTFDSFKERVKKLKEEYKL